MVGRDEIPDVRIVVNGQVLEQVKKFKYLGQWITANGRCESEIKNRIEIARSTFIKMRDVLTSPKLHLEIRKHLVRCYMHFASFWFKTLNPVEHHCVRGAIVISHLKSLQFGFFHLYNWLSNLLFCNHCMLFTLATSCSCGTVSNTFLSQNRKCLLQNFRP